jgi:hypothetical protein
MGHSRWVILTIVSALSFVLPAALCLGLAFTPARSAADIALASFAAGLLMALLVLVN